MGDRFYPFYDGFECESDHLNTDFPILQYSDGKSLTIRFNGKPINCEVSEWGEWSTCDKKCGGGKQTRSRSLLTAAKNGGASCGVLTEEQDCNVVVCKPWIYSPWTVTNWDWNTNSKHLARTVIQVGNDGTPQEQL